MSVRAAAAGEQGVATAAGAVAIMAPAETQMEEHSSKVDNAAPSSDAAAAKHGISNGDTAADVSEAPPAKRARLDEAPTADGQAANGAPERPKGTAPIKAEYVSCPVESMSPLTVVLIAAYQVSRLPAWKQAGSSASGPR